MKLTINYAAQSNKGLIRTNNEDTVYAGNRLLAVADGMGGHAAGEVASQIIIAHLAPLDNDNPGTNMLEDLNDAIQLGNDAIHAVIEKSPQLAGMGTTLTALLFDGPKIGLAHVGDSRAYLLRGNKLEQITRDDTLVQKMIDEGELTPEEAAHHPQRSVIMHALTGEKVNPTLVMREMLEHDRYLLCSDGLTDVLSDETIKEILQNNSEVDKAAEEIIKLTLKSGAPDNVTVVVAEAIESNYLQTDPIVAGAASEEEISPTVDSAAIRAAKLSSPPNEKPINSKPEKIAPVKKSIFSKKNLLIVLVILLILTGIGGIIGYQTIKSTYYLGTDEGVITVYKGLRGPVLGKKITHVDSKICINNLDAHSKVDEKQIIYYAADSAIPENCTPLQLRLLDQSSVSALNSLPNAANLSTIHLQIVNITKHILPKCAPKPKKSPELVNPVKTKQTVPANKPCRLGGEHVQ